MNKKYKVFPENYDPMIASGPCPDDLKGTGLEWTPAQTENMKNLENQAIFQDFKPRNRVYMILS